jgi:hypothetical protein
MDKRQAIFLLIGIIIIGAAAGWWRAKHRETLPPVKLCYTRNTEDGGHADIAMRISNGRAIGEFSYIPSEKDSMKDLFAGRFRMRMVGKCSQVSGLCLQKER